MNAPDDTLSHEEESPSSAPQPSARSVEEVARFAAHAINNPLAALAMELDLAAELLESADPSTLVKRVDEARKVIAEARRSADRVHAVVENLWRAPMDRDRVTQAPPVVSVPPVSAARPVAARAASVLVVDDDVLVANAVKRTLRAHHVTVAANAREALARFEAGERFDVVLCDLMMPEITGMDFYERLQAIAPEQISRVVFVTGGAVTTRARDFVATTRNPVVDKPFDVRKLRDVIARSLG